MKSMSDELFQIFEPVPPRCQAVTVTVDNIDKLARHLGYQMTSATVEYAWGHEAVLRIHQDAYTPRESDQASQATPALDLTVRLGEMLVLHTPAQPGLELCEGWNVLAENDSWIFQKRWRTTP